MLMNALPVAGSMLEHGEIHAGRGAVWRQGYRRLRQTTTQYLRQGMHPYMATNRSTGKHCTNIQPPFSSRSGLVSTCLQRPSPSTKGTASPSAVIWSSSGKPLINCHSSTLPRSLVCIPTPTSREFVKQLKISYHILFAYHFVLLLCHSSPSYSPLLLSVSFSFSLVLFLIHSHSFSLSCFIPLSLSLLLSFVLSLSLPLVLSLSSPLLSLSLSLSRSFSPILSLPLVLFLSPLLLFFSFSFSLSLSFYLTHLFYSLSLSLS